MKKLYCVICGNYRKFKKPTILSILVKILVLSIICRKCKNKDEKIFKEEELIEMLKILGLIKYRIALKISQKKTLVKYLD